MPYYKKYAKKNSRRTYRPRRTVSKGATKTMYRIAKKVTLKMTEPKMACSLHSSLDDPGHLSLAHNTPDFITGLLNTSQGMGANPGTNVRENRIGNEIIITGLKLRMQVINAVTQSNVNYKYWVFWYNAQDIPTVGSDVFCGPGGGGGNMNRMIDFIDTRKITVIKSGHIYTSSRTANMNQTQAGVGQEGRLQERMHTQYRDVWIPFKNKKIRYDDNNSPIPKFKDIGVMMLAYDVNNTSQATILGYWDLVSRLYFRDP